MKIHLKGNWATREVWLNGKKLSPAKSLKVYRHSPDGFAWNYSGSGPSQLALAICLELFGKDVYGKEGGMHYQTFKEKYIATLPASDFDQYIEVETKKVEV